MWRKLLTKNTPAFSTKVKQKKCATLNDYLEYSLAQILDELGPVVFVARVECDEHLAVQVRLQPNPVLVI